MFAQLTPRRLVFVLTFLFVRASQPQLMQITASFAIWALHVPKQFEERARQLLSSLPFQGT